MHDVIVIGGGIAGTSTAYFLASEGVSVLLLERDDLNTQASGSNSGSLHVQVPVEPFVLEGSAWAQGFAPVVRLLAEGVALWQRLPEILGADLELRIKGGITAASSDEGMLELRRKAAFERAQGIHIELLDSADVKRLAPYFSESIVGGAYCPLEGSANPFLATPAMARAARVSGVTIMTHTEVRGIERSAGAFEVATNRGVFQAGRVVNAAGADSGRVAAMVGVKLEMDGFPIQVTVTERVAPLFQHLLYYTGEKLTLKQTKEGTIIIGGGWPAMLDRQGRPVVSGDSLERNLRVAVDAVPALGNIEVVRSWAAIVNGTRDWKPILGECPGVAGFFIIFVPWLGFTAGPIAGQITASLVRGRAAPVETDVSSFLL
jgi:sarcosine oxidase subunit beta